MRKPKLIRKRSWYTQLPWQSNIADHRRLRRSAAIRRCWRRSRSRTFGQQLIESLARDLDQHRLPQGFGFDRLRRTAIAAAAIVLGDHQKIVVIDLLCRQRQPFPPQGANRLFRNAPGVLLNLVTGKIMVADVWECDACGELSSTSFPSFPTEHRTA